MASTNVMVKKCAGLVDTRDVTDWENRFLQSVIERSANGDHPERLTSAQVESLERIYEKHFEG
jgi:hypothetical protein